MYGWKYEPPDDERADAERRIGIPDLDPSVVETYLGTLETSDDFCTPKAYNSLLTARADRAAFLLQWTQHMNPGYTAAKRAQQIKHKAAMIAYCSSEYILMSVDGEFQVHPIRCRQRDCPVCQAIHATEWMHRMKQSLKLWTAPKHVVLTLRSSTDPLQDQLSRLVRCFRKLRQRKFWRKANPWGYWTIEITHNAGTGLFHPHLHIIVNAAFIPWELIKYWWEKLTGDSFDVEIKTVTEDIAGHIAHYIAKTATVWSAPVDPAVLLSALRGKRLVNKLGRWPTLPKPEHPLIVVHGSIVRILARAHSGDPLNAYLAGMLCREFPRAVQSSLLNRFAHCLDPPT